MYKYFIYLKLILSLNKIYKQLVKYNNEENLIKVSNILLYLHNAYCCITILSLQCF